MGNPAQDEPDFYLDDAEGNSHEYHVTPHDPRRGTRIIAQLSQALTGPIGQFLDEHAEQLLVGDRDLDDIEVEEILEDTNFVDLAQSLSQTLDEDKAEAFVATILRNTHRDGQPLGKDKVFRNAYQQNYMEMFRAVAEVIKYNGFLGSIGT